MKKLKLHERLRLIIQCLSFCFHNGYVRGWLNGKIYSGANKAFCMPGLNCYSCPGAVGACPIGSLQAVLDSGQYRVSLYVFGFIAAVGVFCGRFVCGWLCPFGLVQDLLHRIPIFKKKKNLPGHSKLRWLRYVILVVFVIVLPATIMGPAGSGEPWFCEWICPSGTLLGGIPLVLANSSLRAACHFRFAWKCALLLAVIVLSIKFYRPFCKYVCPLGALYGLANPISIYRLKCDETTCVKCGACQRACGMDIKVWEKPNSVDCIRCGKCMAACPTGALTSTFTRKKKTGPNGEPSEVSDVVLSGAAAVSGIQETAAEPQAAVKEAAAEAVEAPAVEAPAQQADTAPTGAAPARKTKKGAAAGYFFLALLCIGISVFVILRALFQLIFLTKLPEYSLTYHLYMMAPGLCAIVPAVLLIIMAHYLFHVRKHPEYIEQLREWPVKILIVTLVSFLVACVMVLVSEWLGEEFAISLLWRVPVYIMDQWSFIFVLAAAVTLIAMLPLHRKKAK